MNPPVVTAPVAPAVTLASLYEVNDPEPTYQLTEVKPTTPPSTLQTGAALAVASAPSAPTFPLPTAQPQVAPNTAVGHSAASVPPPPAAPSAPQTQQPQSQHPAWLLNQATSLGIHPLVIERLDPQGLTQVVIETQGRLMADHSDRSRAATIQQPATPQHQAAAAATQAQVAAQPVAPQEPPFDWGTFEDEVAPGQKQMVKFTDDMLNPAIAHHIKKLTKQITELQGFIGNMGRQAQESREAAIQREFDAAFNRIPQVFGNGTAASLQGTPEFQRRKIIYQAVKGMFSAMPKEALANMSVESGVLAMAKQIFNADPSVAAAAAPQPQPQHAPQPQHHQNGNGQQAANGVWNNGIVAVPTQRRASDQQYGRDRAVAGAQQMFQEWQANGAFPQGGDTSIDEFLQ